MTDAEIVELSHQAAAGDDAAWTQLCTVFTRHLVSWARRAGASSAELDDIANVVWCNVWRAMQAGKRFESGAKFMAFLAQCTRRQVIDQWRKSQVRPQCFSLEEADRPVSNFTFFMELDGLTKREQRLAALLLYGYTVSDIARHDGISDTAVYSQRAKMRAHWHSLSQAITGC